MWRQRPATNHEGSGADSDRWNWMVTGGLSKDIFCHSEFAGIKMKIRKLTCFEHSKIPGIKLSSFGTAYLYWSMQTLAEYVNIQDRWYRPLFAFFWEQLLNRSVYVRTPGFLIVLCLPSSELDGATSLPPRVGPWKRIPLRGWKKRATRSALLSCFSRLWMIKREGIYIIYCTLSRWWFQIFFMFFF